MFHCPAGTMAAAAAAAVTPLASANTSFSLALLKKLGDKDNTANVFFSPFSISSALAMVLLGARGNTAAQMSEVQLVKHAPHLFKLSTLLAFMRVAFLFYWHTSDTFPHVFGFFWFTQPRRGSAKTLKVRKCWSEVLLKDYKELPARKKTLVLSSFILAVATVAQSFSVIDQKRRMLEEKWWCVRAKQTSL